MTEFIGLNNIKIKAECFKENSTITSVDCNDIDFVNNNAEEAFSDCSELVSVNNLSNNITSLKSTFRNCQKMITPPSIPSAVTNMQYTFYDCRGMTSAPDLSNCTNLTNIMRCFAYNYELLETPIIPESVTDMRNICQGCKKISSFPNIPDGVTDLTYAFDQCQNVVNCNIEIPSQITNMNHTFFRCNNLKGKIFIHSENITDATDCFADTTLTKKVYIPFQNDGNDTITYTSFTTAGYDDLGTTNGVILLDLNEYVPPIHYDFDNQDGESNDFIWTTDLTIPQSASNAITTINTTGINCGQNMSINGNVINHTSNNEQTPGNESYVGFLFNVGSGMFKPTALDFDICKNGTNGGSVQIAIKFDNMDEEETICTLETIARSSEQPPYTTTHLDLSTFNLGASIGTVMIKFYLYNQSSSKTFSLSNITISGLLYNKEESELNE